jgi:hypothetical protein
LLLRRIRCGFIWETYGYEVFWARRAGDDLIITIAQNSVTADDNIFSLYLALLDILEPQSVVNPETAPLSSSPPGSMDPGNIGG